MAFVPAARLFRVRDEIDDRHFRVPVRRKGAQLPVKFREMGFVLFRARVGEARCFADDVLVPRQRGEGRKLRRAVGARHMRVRHGNVVRQIQHIVVLAHALCPPTCSFRSFAVAPSSKFFPFKMAFLPYLFLISSTASCRRFSFSNAASSASRFAASAP